MTCNCNYLLFFVWQLWKLINIFHYCEYVTITQYHCIMIGQQKNDRILYHENYHLIEKPVITLKTHMHMIIILEFFEKYKCPGTAFCFCRHSRCVSNEQPCLKITGVYEDLLLLSSLFHFFYSIFNAPFHLVYVSQFLHLFFFNVFLKSLSSVVESFCMHIYNLYFRKLMKFFLTKKFMTFRFHLFDLVWIEC